MLGSNQAPDVAALADLPLTPDGVVALRSRFYDDHAIDIDEGDILFALARTVGERGCAEWRDFFREAICDLLVHQINPAGYLTEAKAVWLIARLEGHPTISTEFATLLRVLELSRFVPDRLAAFALGLVRDVVLTGEGEAITGERHEPGRVTRADVDALRRVLFVASSEGFGHVTRAEANVLFEIADATVESDNDSSFADLFARAVGNHLLAGAGRFAPTRSQALSRESWLNQRRTLGGGIGSTFKAMAAHAFGIASRRDAEDAQDTTPENPLATVHGRSPERVDEEEVSWLIARMEARPGLSEAERALLAFLQEECAALPEPLVALAAEAA